MAWPITKRLECRTIIQKIVRFAVGGAAAIYDRRRRRRPQSKRTSERSHLPACLPTIHLLLHLGRECLENCGPVWVYWQFVCERICGMLKRKAKNRAAADRNLSIGVLQVEQLNHLRFTSNFEERKIRRPIPLYSR